MKQVSDFPDWFEETLSCYRRIETKPVRVGKLVIGNGNPIWIQSMVNTDTMDTEATVAQIKRLADVGCHIARITVPSITHALNLEVIKNRLIASGYDIPLVADVHFTPQAAEISAGIVEKVRINPGNFVDRKRFELKEYQEEEYQKELIRVEEKLLPILEVCRKHGTALRIGSNHGSLSDRIFNRYGDGPEGMVQSALEFLDICERFDFDQVVFSMKSSNTLVMAAAYRLLTHRLWERGAFYPVHLGVTEAGDDEDGRAKSALGIGSLLMDGIGDTIRVSLTEDPEKEVPVAQKIIAAVQYLTSRDLRSGEKPSFVDEEIVPSRPLHSIDPFTFSRVSTETVGTWGGNFPAQVIFSPACPLREKSDLTGIGIHQIPDTEKWHSTHSPDLLFCRENVEDFPLYSVLMEAGQKVILGAGDNLNYRGNLLFDNADSFYTYYQARKKSSSAKEYKLDRLLGVKCRPADFKSITKCFQDYSAGLSNIILVVEMDDRPSVRMLRHFILALKGAGINQPIALSMAGTGYFDKWLESPDEEARKVMQAIFAGYLLVDGLIDGVMMEGSPADLKYLFSILQASRQRISKPEYISCPSCGRTLFNLQEVTAQVKAATHHLVGVKIAVMGCIVNGPGEMADADFGYVGSGPDKITLYRGKEIRLRNVDSKNAVQELINLIKQEGYWQEPTKENKIMEGKIETQAAK